jgi:hypothetical protein
VQALSALPRPATLAAPQGVEAARRLVLAQPPGTRIVLVGGDGTVQPLLAAALVQRASAARSGTTARALGLVGMLCGWPSRTPCRRRPHRWTWGMPHRRRPAPVHQQPGRGLRRRG